MGLIPVPDSAELRRILSLPRRTADPAVFRALAEQWSPQLLNERGRALWEHCSRLPPAVREAELARIAVVEKAPLRMKWEQAWVAYEFVTNPRALAVRPGAVVNGPVGVGKTFLGYLLALLAQLHFGARRPLTLTPGSISDDTRRAYVHYSKFWQMPRPIPDVETYEALGKPQNEFRLCRCRACTNGAEIEERGPTIEPDFVFLDESDLLRNPDSAVSKRWDRYVINHMPFAVPATGTPVRKSLRNLHRHLVWGVGPALSPLPVPWHEIENWCGAADESPRDGLRSPPGALWQLTHLTAPELDALDDATRLEVVRSAIGQRIAETPGVITIDESSCDQPIAIEVVEAEADRAVDEAFAHFRTTDCTPDGWRLGDIFSVLRHGGQLGRGYYQRWNPRPPQWYIDARNAWNAHVKMRIEDSKTSGRPIDREGVVARLDKNTQVYQDWKAAQQTFGKPNVEAIPISFSILSWLARELQTSGPALVWVKERWAGQTLSQMTGIPFFAGKGMTETGYKIQNHSPTSSVGGGHAIMSVNANRRGRHLPAWSVNYVLGVEHSAERNEQMLGRTHRYGQERPVTIRYVVSCAEDLQALESALAEAQNAQAVGRIRQKLLNAAWDWTKLSPEALQPWSIPAEQIGRRLRWTRRL